MRARFAGEDLSHKPTPPGEPELLERAADAEWWLREYRLTPAQKAELPGWLVVRIPTVVEVRREARR